MAGEGPRRPLWRCPKCGHRFVTKNMWHSCGRYRIESFGRLGYGHHFRLRRPTELDDALARLIREAYAIGRQAAPRGFRPEA